MKDEKQSFHNPKTIVIKEPNTKKKIKIDFWTTQEKVLLNLDESPREKELHFELTFRQAKKSPVEILVFSFVGCSGSHLKSSSPVFFPLWRPGAEKRSWGRNFCIFWSRGFRHMWSYENLFLWPVSFWFTLFFPFEIVHLQSIFLCLSKHFPGDCAFWLFINFFLKIFIFSWTLWIFLCFSFCMFATKTSWLWDILCFSYVWSENPYLLVNKTPALNNNSRFARKWERGGN